MRFLHTLAHFADIKIVLKTVLIIFTVLIFPIFVNFDFLLKKDLKRLFLGVHLFGMIPVAGGYVERGEKEFILHLSEKKAIILPYEKVFSIRKKFKPLKDYHFIGLWLVLDIGSDNGSVTPLAVGGITDYVLSIFKNYFYFSKPYLKINSTVNVFMGEDVFNVYFSGTVVFNFLMVVLSVAKILTEKIFYACRKGKKQNQ